MEAKCGPQFCGLDGGIGLYIREIVRYRSFSNVEIGSMCVWRNRFPKHSNLGFPTTMQCVYLRSNIVIMTLERTCLQRRIFGTPNISLFPFSFSTLRTAICLSTQRRNPPLNSTASLTSTQQAKIVERGNQTQLASIHVPQLQHRIPTDRICTCTAQHRPRSQSWSPSHRIASQRSGVLSHVFLPLTARRGGNSDRSAVDSASCSSPSAMAVSPI